MSFGSVGQLFLYIRYPDGSSDISIAVHEVEGEYGFGFNILRDDGGIQTEIKGKIESSMDSHGQEPVTAVLNTHTVFVPYVNNDTLRREVSRQVQENLSFRHILLRPKYSNPICRWTETSFSWRRCVRRDVMNGTARP